jgi:hypothetical protein
MPTPLPDPTDADLTPPGADEVVVLGRGVLGAVTPASGLTTTQMLLAGAVFDAMTGHPVDTTAPALGPVEFGGALARRTLEFRTRIVQVMVLLALVVRPLTTDVTDRVAAYARELGVEEGMLEVAGRFAGGSLGLAAVDFERNGYTAAWHPEDARVLHTSRELSTAWEASTADPVLADRWAALEDLPDGTLGRRLAEFYRARGFVYPGLPGSAPPLLAQHDWVHVVADYGTTVESELEVFAFIARANDDMRGFSLLAMVVSLFETGYLRTGAGLFEYSPGHLSESGMAVRVADAMRRGALCHGSIDFLRTDWFSLADRTVEEVRTSFGVTPKSPGAGAAGSVGPWEVGGISPFQVAAGRALSDSLGRPYEPYGARAAVGDGDPVTG